MTKKKEAYKVDVNLTDLLAEIPRPNERPKNALSVTRALEIVIQQMRGQGRRERTIRDYELHVADFARVNGNPAVQELSADHIYRWLSSMNVSNSTKNIRLKCLKAFLGRCHSNGWLTRNFWNEIRIKADTPVKEGAVDRDVHRLLSLLDLTDFVQLRDATAVLVMYQTGLRVGTLAKLRHQNVDLGAKLLRVGGELVKNHDSLYLPFDDVLARFLETLMNQNEIVRTEHNVRNDYLFITRYGSPITAGQSHNNIQKQLYRYARRFGLRNINPHALRRGFAKNLLKKGADLTLISKALGHSDLSVTTRYLHLDKEEVAENLRKYL